MTETEIQQQIITTARTMGHKAYRMNSGKVRIGNRRITLCEPGTPDLLIVMSGGRLLWIEVKRPGERPTETQKKRHKELRDMGHSVAVCHSLDDFLVALQEVAA